MNDSAFPIVGIGASAGGLEAFRSFFAAMRDDSGMAFVLILHLPADRKSLLAEILGRWTRMPVRDAPDRTAMKPNCVFVPPPHTLVTLQDGCLRVRSPAEGDPQLFRPIDVFFDSLGTVLGERAISVVLSGTGSDGALGLKVVKERGGLTMAQGSGHDGPRYGEMPAGAIATGAVDIVAAVEEIPVRLLQMRANGLAEHPLATAPEAQDTSSRLEICAILRARLGHDFSGYRDKTFMRRVQRRMQVMNVGTLDDYVAVLRASPNEATSLFRDLLIRVTSFFRDAETFAALEAKVIPPLFTSKDADNGVRVWVPGCATGEEAYSLAILLREHLDRLSTLPRVSVFATDLDDAAIGTARLGRYPATLLEGLSPERRKRFFKASQGSYQVTTEIRELCVFSPHNLVRDPPFSRMDLVSCRNLLIYMDARQQAAIVPKFHYALVPGGTLLLGSAESVGGHAELFEALDAASRIFRRRDGKSPPMNLTSSGPFLDALSLAPRSAQKAGNGAEARISGPGPSATAPTNRRRANTKMPARYRVAGLGAAPEVGGTTDSIASDSNTPRADSVHSLRDELTAAHELLQSLTEQYQTAVEELRSSNEELHSVNEEMQSANEELETSKEELQSVNEELSTVNTQLSEKVHALDVTNSDLRNLFDSTQVATIFLDRSLIIRNFTPAIVSLYNLIPSDQGRPLTDIASRLEYDGLRDDVAHVLETLEPLERRISRRDRATHYIMRILPYREPDSTVSGALVTFVDVTSIVHAEEALIEADLRKDVFLATLSHELRNPLAPIRTAARVLETPGLEPAQLAKAQAVISRQVRHMSALLDDLLDVSRVTRGSFVLKKEYVETRVLLEAAIEAVQPAIDARRHTLRVEYPRTGLTLEADPVRLTQVLVNLLTNAVRYTPAGGLIGVEVRLEQHCLCLIVRDNGIGLEPRTLHTIFHMFARVESAVDGAGGGLGIGLALAKGLIELHGGHIEARSAGLGKGSEFIVSLPRTIVVDEPHNSTDQPTAGAPPEPSHRVLVVDDNRDGAESLGAFLGLHGHQVELAFTGTDALDAAQRFRPEIIVCDIGLPDLSGYEVARRVRLEAWGAQVLLIALTGWGQESDKRRSGASGFDQHLTKPVDPDELVRLFGLLSPAVRPV